MFYLYLGLALIALEIYSQQTEQVMLKNILSREMQNNVMLERALFAGKTTEKKEEGNELINEMLEVELMQEYLDERFKKQQQKYEKFKQERLAAPTSSTDISESAEHLKDE